jgi:hypothetical protein
MRAVRLARRLRVLDPRLRPGTDAELLFAPFGIRLRADANGLADLDTDVPPLLGPGQTRVTSLASLSAGGQAVPLQWYPQLVLGRGGPGTQPGSVELDLGGLGSRSLGAHLMGNLVLQRSTAESRELDRLLGRAPAQAAEVYGAGMTASPVANREGVYGWQQNLSYGGGIYQVSTSGGTVSGVLSITAPSEAYNQGGGSSGCEATPGGAVIAGWEKRKICWVPVGGTTTGAPEDGASTFGASAEVTVAGDSSLLSVAAATGAYTLYTVGHDTVPPIITPTLSSGASLALLPEIVALARDNLSGVDALEGVHVTLNGADLMATYDPATLEIRLDAAHRIPPDGITSPATLAIEVRDGFCNVARMELEIRSGQFEIFAPYASQR